MAIFPRMHVSLYVRDLSATLAFYTTFFGQAPTKVKPGYAKYTLAEPSLIISFVENADRVQPYFGHLGFQVETPADLETRLIAARAAGLVTLEEVGTACCYAKQDKFWATDPDGVQWEVYYFHEDAEFNDPHYQAEYDGAGANAKCCIAPTDTATNTAAALPVALTFALPTLAVSEAAACAPGGGCC
jgi:catechol 2,3-dioxygenase-like lactoylglutathione lyase family enzyme